MKKISKNILIILTIIILVSLCYFISIFISGSFLFPTSTVQVLYTPNRDNIAVLKRTDGIDLNFKLFVNGQKVYSSPDFAPDRRIDFKERIVWDKSGNIIILEVAGKRLFGYNIKTNKPLSDKDLLSIEYAPDPDISSLGFEGEWPEDRLKNLK